MRSHAEIMALSNAWRGPQGRFVLSPGGRASERGAAGPVFAQWEGEPANMTEREEPLRCTHVGQWPVDVYYDAMARGLVRAPETTR